MLTIILATITILSLIIIITIVARRFPQIAAVDLENLPNEKSIEVKAKIIEERLRRRIGGSFNKFLNLYFMPLWLNLKIGAKNFFLKMIELEKYYKREARHKEIQNIKSGEKDDLIKEKLKQATEKFDQEDYKQAEELFIEVIGMDAKNFEAYLALAKVYLTLKDFEHAGEIYEHLLKLDSKNDSALSGLAELSIKQNNLQQAAQIYEKILEITQDNPNYFYNLSECLEKIGEIKKALEIMQQAVKIKPNDPRLLDYLLVLSIMNKKKLLAYKTLDQLKAVNPENQKLVEFKKKIEEM